MDNQTVSRFHDISVSETFGNVTSLFQFGKTGPSILRAKSLEVEKFRNDDVNTRVHFLTGFYQWQCIVHWFVKHLSCDWCLDENKLHICVTGFPLGNSTCIMNYRCCWHCSCCYSWITELCFLSCWYGICAGCCWSDAHALCLLMVMEPVFPSVFLGD